MNQIKQLFANNTVLTIVGGFGTGKTYNASQLAQANVDNNQINIIITYNDSAVNYAKHVCSEEPNIRFISLRNIVAFADDIQQIVTTSDTEFEGNVKLSRKIVTQLEELSQRLVHKNQIITLILDNCRLELKATILDYLKTHILKPLHRKNCYVV